MMRFTIRWGRLRTVLEGMIRDASILDERYGPSAEDRLVSGFRRRRVDENERN